VQLSSRSDEELVTLARRGWPAPFAVLLHRHGADRPRRAAGRSDPDEAVVRTFTRAMQQLRRVDPAAPVEPWLLALAPGRRGRTAAPADPGPAARWCRRSTRCGRNWHRGGRTGARPDGAADLAPLVAADRRPDRAGGRDPVRDDHHRAARAVPDTGSEPLAGRAAGAGGRGGSAEDDADDGDGRRGHGRHGHDDTGTEEERTASVGRGCGGTSDTAPELPRDDPTTGRPDPGRTGAGGRPDRRGGRPVSDATQGDVRRRRTAASAHSMRGSSAPGTWTRPPSARTAIG
jgi:hypothetical protein